MNRINTVTITGASAGVGRATARAFAKAGANIALLARGEERLEEAAAELRRLGVRALPISVDVADADAVEDASLRVESELGPIDVWVNDAMATIFAPFEQIEPAEFERATKVTYLGFVWGTRAALRRMRARDRGVIVQVGSALAYRGIPLQSAYCGAKHAMRGFNDSIRTELLHDGSNIKVATVHLAAMNTPQFGWGRNRLPHAAQPVPPIYQPEVAARAIIAMARRPRREVWVGAPTAVTIIGNKIAPGIADWYLARTGFDSQQILDEAPPAGPDNLFEPAPGADIAAHGSFDDRAHAHSPFTWAVTHRRTTATLAGVVAGGAASAIGIAMRGRSSD